MKARRAFFDFVLQDLDFFACCDDFSVGQAVPPVTAGYSRRLVVARLLCGAALQAAAPISSALFEARCSASRGRLKTGCRMKSCPTYLHIDSGMPALN
jgi:hypothetical protein